VKATKRTRIAADWQPSPAGDAFAREKGVDPGELVEAFRDYHLGHGSVMADWEAAWRTWVRNDVKFAKRRAAFSVVKGGTLAALDDAYGTTAWAAALTGTEPQAVNGETRLSYAGCDIAGYAADLCEAAQMDPTRVAVGLDLVPGWVTLVRESAGVRSGKLLDDLVAAVAAERRKFGREVTSLRFFEKLVERLAEKARGERQEALL
jgi:hypothetical protein